MYVNKLVKEDVFKFYFVSCGVKFITFEFLDVRMKWSLIIYYSLSFYVQKEIKILI